MSTAAKTKSRYADEPGWSVERFADFWSAPAAVDVPFMVTDDVVGWWPGADEPVRGVEAYTKALADLMELLPDIRLTVAESATSGEFAFIRWVMHATGRKGPFEFTGIDRLRVRGGRVCENFIRFDMAHFQRLAGLV